MNYHFSLFFGSGLPEKFVSAMRTLFDVMDDNKTGFISLADIESRWCSDKEEGGSVPPGVIDSLRLAPAILTELRVHICIMYTVSKIFNPMLLYNTVFRIRFIMIRVRIRIRHKIEQIPILFFFRTVRIDSMPFPNTRAGEPANILSALAPAPDFFLSGSGS